MNLDNTMLTKALIDDRIRNAQHHHLVAIAFPASRRSRRSRLASAWENRGWRTAGAHNS